MKRNKKRINESITESAISPLGYIIFIDASAAIGGDRNGYIKMMFPSETPDVIKNWYSTLTGSKSYGDVKDKLRAIGSRFSNNPSLKALFNSLSKLKKSSYAEEDKESHENDIELIIKRISIYIKRKLTEEDIKVLETIVEEINSVVENVSQKIDDEITSMATPTEEMPEDEPKEEETEEEKPKTEIKVNERLRSKLRKKIKEIIRTHLFAN
jgi:vacuolar-type H+-ATPase subunit I/STV1